MTLSARGLGFAYDGFNLRVESLEVAPGRLTVVVGPNGAGKTTLLRCLSGLLPLGSGTVTLDGRDVAALGETRRARLLAYVPQEHTPAFGFTVLDVVLMGRAAYVPLLAAPSPLDERLAGEALDYVGLAGQSGRPYVQLSSGERRLVLIARALAQRAGVLVLDEPTTFLDPRHAADVMALARRLASQEGKTVLLTSHDLMQAARHADVLVVLKDGRIAAAGPPASVLSESLLESVYGLPMRLVPFEGRTLIVS